MPIQLTARERAAARRLANQISPHAKLTNFGREVEVRDEANRFLVYVADATRLAWSRLDYTVVVTNYELARYVRNWMLAVSDGKTQDWIESEMRRRALDKEQADRAIEGLTIALEELEIYAGELFPIWPPKIR